MLKQLRDDLASKKSKKIYIPDTWNLWNLDVLGTEGSQVIVDENAFLVSIIDSIYKEGDYSKSLSLMTNEPHWINNAVAYSMMIRSSSTWDYNHDGKITPTEIGTFVRTLFLLPYLKHMGVNLLYLLPISKYSLKDKKGELGSVYGVQNFFEFDPKLKHKTSLTIEEEFQALVEAAHMLGMRVMIDVIPRTNAVNSDLIQEHPDWFYWIKKSEYKNYGSPLIESIDGMTQPYEEYLERIYTADTTKAHIKRFVENPGNHPDWDKYKHDLSLVKKHLGVVVAPAFSDHVNDTQPPWTDVTFFRLYMDESKQAKQYLTGKEAPYILFDTIKGNLYQGEIKNQELWDMLASVIPYYQNFGVDGARIDMGHALPKELTNLILGNAKAKDPHFAFVAEEMNPSNDVQSKELGYDMIIGNGFWNSVRYEDGSHKEFYYGAKDLAVPCFASSETHDTKRVAARDGGRPLAKLLGALNFFVPNTVPFINSGQELYETQPMNLGIDCTPEDQFRLEESDPFYGKLALFDKYQFHYTTPERYELLDLFHRASKTRTEYAWIIRKEFMQVIDLGDLICFEFNAYDHRVQVLANFDFKEAKELTHGNVVFSSISDEHVIAPGEVKVIQLF